MLLIANNAAQGILSSFFFKYAGNNMFTYLLNVFKVLFYLIKFFITYKQNYVYNYFTPPLSLSCFFTPLPRAYLFRIRIFLKTCWWYRFVIHASGALATIFIEVSFDIFRYNFEEVLINSCHNLYGHSICCDVWSYFDCKLFVRNFYCIYLNAPGNLRHFFDGWKERKERSVLLLISLFDLLLLFSL